MANRRKRFQWTALLALLFVAAGCAQEMRRLRPAAEGPPDAYSQEAPAPPPPLRLEGLQQRITALKAILQVDQLSPQDQLLAQELLQTYRALEKISTGPAGDEYREALQLLLSNLIQVDQRYFSRFLAEETLRLDVMAHFSARRKQIIDSYLAGDHQGVIDRCIELEKIFGPSSLSQEIGLLFAISLGKRGMIQEALRVGIKITDELERKPGALDLRAGILEWQLALGDKKGAVQSHEKILDAVHEQGRLLKKAGKSLSGLGLEETAQQKRGDPSSSVEFSTEAMSTQEVLSRVDGLVQQNDFEKARILLLRLRLRLQDGPDAEIVDQAMQAVELAEEKSRDLQRTEASQSREALERVSKLIEQQKYEEAITEIETFHQEKSLGPEASQLKDLAVEKIVHREREKAGGLFLMARNTQDPAKKKELLLSSYNILKAIMDKYPSNSLSQRINENLRRVQEELSGLKNRAG